MNTNKDALGFVVTDVYRLLRRAFSSRLSESQLTLAQARALVYISRHEGVRQVELAELLDVQPITLARVIDHLSTHGLVERRPDMTDRRAYLIYLKPEATMHLQAIEEVVTGIQVDASRDLCDEEIEGANKALRKIRANLMSLR